MTHYKLYCIGASGNSYKVALYLNCAGLDWMPVGIDFAGGEQRDAGWRAGVNAMGEVPVLEVDGRGVAQSGAILMWLAETTGHFAPAADQRQEALRWILFDNHKFTNNHAIHRFQRSFTAATASGRAGFHAHAGGKLVRDRGQAPCRSPLHAWRPTDHRRLLARGLRVL